MTRDPFELVGIFGGWLFGVVVVKQVVDDVIGYVRRWRLDRKLTQCHVCGEAMPMRRFLEHWHCSFCGQALERGDGHRCPPGTSFPPWVERSDDLIEGGGGPRP